MQNETKVYPHYLNQAYQAKVMLRKIQIHSVGSRYPHKDHVVITTQNIEKSDKTDRSINYSVTHNIDVVVKCENRLEAIKLNNALKEYLAKDMMLPLDVGVFRKPYTKERESAQKYYAYSNINAKQLLELLPKFEKDSSLKFVVGASPIESVYIFNGFDLTYTLTDYTMDATTVSLDVMKELNKNATSALYKLKLFTTSFYEADEDTALDEALNFEIVGESESEVDTLADKITQLKNNGIPFTCRGRFPRPQKDYYVVPLSKKASDLISEINTLLEKPKPPKAS